MTITRVGSNKKFADGWETVFGGKKSAKSKQSAAASTTKGSKKAATKKVSKKVAAQKTNAKPKKAAKKK